MERNTSIGIVILVLVVLVGFVYINNKSSSSVETCQKPYIMGDNGKCCKDIDEDNLCDPSELKLNYVSNGVGKTDVSGVYEVKQEICNADKYAGRVVAYFGDWSEFYGDPNFDNIKGISDDKKKKFQKQEIYLDKGGCYEFKFNSVYVEGVSQSIKLETYPTISK